MLNRERLGYYRVESPSSAELDQRRAKMSQEDEDFSRAATLPLGL